MLKLDLHTHSKYSDDSRVEPSDIVRLARERGLNGVAVTDHLSLRGGLEARALNRDPMFLVVPGIEYSTPVGHVVGLFLEEEPTVSLRGGAPSTAYPLDAVVAAIHEKGGIAVLAHPFEARMNLPADLFRTSGLDALEGYNGRADSMRTQRLTGWLRISREPRVYLWWVGATLTSIGSVARAGCEILSLGPGASAEQVKEAVLQGLAVPFGIPAPRTASPLTSLVKMRKTGRYTPRPQRRLCG